MRLQKLTRFIFLGYTKLKDKFLQKYMTFEGYCWKNEALVSIIHGVLLSCTNSEEWPNSGVQWLILLTHAMYLLRLLTPLSNGHEEKEDVKPTYITILTCFNTKVIVPRILCLMEFVTLLPFLVKSVIQVFLRILPILHKL